VTLSIAAMLVKFVWLLLFLTMVKLKGSPSVSTPEKAAISRHYQQELSINKRGAATRTAAKFNIGGNGGATKVKSYDTDIMKMNANRKYCGRASGFSEALEENASDV
jgi:hypothetical protein